MCGMGGKEVKFMVLGNNSTADTRTLSFEA